MTRLTIRIDFNNGSALGPGKARLLEQVEATGSIRKAAAAMKMSYRRGWLLLKALEETFGAPLVATATGGKEGGGASLTPLGRSVVAEYRKLEGHAGTAGAAQIRSLARKAVAKKIK
jgi:molybdate transport system regulatory protein